MTKIQELENYLSGDGHVHLDLYDNYNFCGTQIVAISSYVPSDFAEILLKLFGKSWDVHIVLIIP